MEINLVMQKIIQTMPQESKLKVVQQNISVTTFFGQSVYINKWLFLLLTFGVCFYRTTKQIQKNTFKKYQRAFGTDWLLAPIDPVFWCTPGLSQWVTLHLVFLLLFPCRHLQHGLKDKIKTIERSAEAVDLQLKVLSPQKPATDLTNR